MRKILLSLTRVEIITLAVVAAGYLVDAFDLLVFSAVRKPSLLSIGILEADTMNIGLKLLNWQLIGLVIGGLIWGILADKFGRRSILVISIITYSVANISNAFVNSLSSYSALRFIAGIGLSGELGVGISLITESFGKEKRTAATSIVSMAGMLGACFGGIAALFLNWKACYIFGGVAGLALLLFRLSIKESLLFKEVVRLKVKRGNFFKILLSPRLFLTYLLCTLAGGVTFVTIGLFIQNTPEFGKDFSLSPAPTGAWAIIFFYLGAAPSELLAGMLSRRLQSRKLPMYLCYTLTAIAMSLFCFFPPSTTAGYYFRCGLLGLGLGYWTLLITLSAELFGTNIRATAATSIPNIARAWSIPFLFVFSAWLKPSFGLLNGGYLIGIAALALSTIAVMMIRETFENDVNFIH